jgi:S1-C subfamily serine protease
VAKVSESAELSQESDYSAFSKGRVVFAMNMLRTLSGIALVVVAGVGVAFGQVESPDNKKNPVPVSTQWVLDAAGPAQRAAIRSVYLLVCPKTGKKGSAFLLSGGTMVTDNHVVDGCGSGDLWAISPMAERISFSKVITDPSRDLALLRPARRLEGGLELGSDVSPKVGTTVTTWGYPLIYNGPAPLLSVGYVAGYNDAHIGQTIVKHIVVNGAFNPGNSGGPLLAASDNKVVGVVVWKMRVIPEWVQTVISGLGHPSAVTCCAATVTLPDGTKRGISNEEAASLVLQEFYDTVQVMIGEATSVSELKAFLREKEGELR